MRPYPFILFFNHLFILPYAFFLMYFPTTALNFKKSQKRKRKQKFFALYIFNGTYIGLSKLAQTA